MNCHRVTLFCLIKAEMQIVQVRRDLIYNLPASIYVQQDQLIQQSSERMSVFQIRCKVANSAGNANNIAATSWCPQNILRLQ